MGYCGSEEHTTQWNCSDPKCVNCGQNHHARSKECMYYIYNTELKLLQERTGMSIKEAKLELKVRGIQDPAKKNTYSSITKTSNEMKMHADKNNGAHKNKSQDQINALQEKTKIVTNKEMGRNDTDTILTNSFEVLINVRNKRRQCYRVSSGELRYTGK